MGEEEEAVINHQVGRRIKRCFNGAWSVYRSWLCTFMLLIFLGGSPVL